jgi:branched-chain amino acid transport system substrate-binding protein
MVTPSSRGLLRGARLRRPGALLITLALVAGACGGDDDTATSPPTAITDAPQDTAPATTQPDTGESATTDTAPADSKPDGSDPDTSTDDPRAIFPTLAPPTGEPIVLGLVNTEGTPGLDFPDIRLAIAGAADYLNRHGGIGGRPIEIVNCTATGSPETSQACAQEVTGKGVEMVLLGLDLFPDYATYTAAGVPVVGVLPILPGDYTANALFLTGGNATIMAAAAGAAKDHFRAESVGIISADNPGSNSTATSLTASLDALGISHISVKGGDNETDAGYQGLMRQAASGNPDLLISLYSDAGCIGTMRGRASLGIEIPVLTTSICSSADVLDQVGDDALGWNFIGVATPQETPSSAILKEIMAPVLGVEASEVDPTALGLGSLGLFLIMTLAVHGNQMADDGLDVTGPAMFDLLTDVDGLTLWPGDSPIDCGAAPAYPSICSFIFPFAEYVEGGEIRTIPGLEAVSSLEFLP